jgi:hypothetical protein
MGPRAGLSTVLVAGAFVLLIAIAIGNNMGNRVLGQIGSRSAGAVATPIPSPSVSADDDAAGHVLWKRRQVLSVATDPAFPDPRVTPEPPPPPPPSTPRPKPAATRTPAPRITEQPDDTGSSAPPYTSPPMPIPLVTHSGDETATPDANQSPAPASRTGPVATPRPGASAHAVTATASPGVSTINP